MRRQHPVITRQAPPPPIDSDISPAMQTINNSLEIMRGYYLEKIEELNNRLRELNLMENAREIATVCNEVIRAKKALYQLNSKTGLHV